MTEAVTASKETFGSFIMRAFVGLMFAPGGFALLIAALTTRGLEVGEGISMLIGSVLMLAIGLSAWFPTAIGLRCKPYVVAALLALKSFLSGCATIWRLYLSKILPPHVIGGVILLGLCALIVVLLISHTPHSSLQKFTLGAGAIMVGYMGLQILFGIDLMMLLGLAILLVITGIGLGLIYWAYITFGAIPCAIVLGSLIIASALKNR